MSGFKIGVIPKLISIDLIVCVQSAYQCKGIHTFLILSTEVNRPNTNHVKFYILYSNFEDHFNLI